VGERSGRSYRLGDDVEIIVSRVNLEDRKIDFDLTDAIDNPDKPKKKIRKRKVSSKAAGAAVKDSNKVKSGKSSKKIKAKKKKKSASRPGKKERAKNKVK